jgi:hypothetical protein
MRVMKRSGDRVAMARDIERMRWGLAEIPPPGDQGVAWLLDRWVDLPTERMAAWRDRLAEEEMAAWLK